MEKMKIRFVFCFFAILFSQICKAENIIYPPQYYTCVSKPNKGCWCEQNVSQYFPERFMGSGCPIDKTSFIRLSRISMVDSEMKPYIDYAGKSGHVAKQITGKVPMRHGNSAGWYKGQGRSIACMQNAKTTYNCDLKTFDYYDAL